MYLQLPLRQWGAGNVYLLVLSSWMVNIAENTIAVMGLYIRSGQGSYIKFKLSRQCQPFNHKLNCMPNLEFVFEMYSRRQVSNTSLAIL